MVCQGLGGGVFKITNHNLKILSNYSFTFTKHILMVNELEKRILLQFIQKLYLNKAHTMGELVIILSFFQWFLC